MESIISVRSKEYDANDPLGIYLFLGEEFILKKPINGIIITKVEELPSYLTGKIYLIYYEDYDLYNSVLSKLNTMRKRRQGSILPLTEKQLNTFSLIKKIKVKKIRTEKLINKIEKYFSIKVTPYLSKKDIKQRIRLKELSNTLL